MDRTGNEVAIPAEISNAEIVIRIFVNKSEYTFPRNQFAPDILPVAQNCLFSDNFVRIGVL